MTVAPRMALAILFFCACQCTAESPPPVKPQHLSKGDTIMFVAPAGETNLDAVARARYRLETLGYRVLVPETIGRRRGYLAGSDEERAKELMNAFMHPDVDAIFPVTGGYGTTRLLNLLDFDVICANPKIFIGFSDSTALPLAIQKKAQVITFHSPNPMWGLGSEDMASMKVH